MKKTWMKKMVSTVLAGAMVLSMAACGGGGGESAPTTAAAGGGSGDSTQAAPAADGEQKVIKIGRASCRERVWLKV